MVMTVPLFVVMFALMWALYIMISIVMFLKRTNKINTHWSRKMVTLAALLSLQGLCLSFLGTVGNTWSWWLSFPFQRKVKLPSEQLMTTFLPCHYFRNTPSYISDLIPCSTQHIIFFHLANIKLHGIYHDCRACFTFSFLLHEHQVFYQKGGAHVL